MDRMSRPPNCFKEPLKATDIPVAQNECVYAYS